MGHVFNYHQYKQNEVNSVRECCAEKIIMNRSAVLVILIPLQTFRSWPLISGVPSTLESLHDLHTPRNRFFFPSFV